MTREPDLFDLFTPAPPAPSSDGCVESKTGGPGRCPSEHASGAASQGEAAEATGKDALAGIAQAVKPAQPAASDRRIPDQPQTAYSADRQVAGVAPGPSEAVHLVHITTTKAQAASGIPMPAYYDKLGCGYSDKGQRLSCTHNRDDGTVTCERCLEEMR